MRRRQDMKKAARENLKGYGRANAIVAAIFIYVTVFISYSAENLMLLFRQQREMIASLSSLLIFVLGAAFSLGASAYFLKFRKSYDTEIGNFFSSFGNIFRAVALSFLKVLFISLWTLLLVFPGIIASYRYRMAEFIMAENPDISPLEAINLSKKMMEGKKSVLFEMDMSFLGWFLLSSITLGVVGLYALPYYYTVQADFFLQVRDDYIDELKFREEWNEKRNKERQTGEYSSEFMNNEKKQQEWNNHTWNTKDKNNDTQYL